MAGPRHGPRQLRDLSTMIRAMNGARNTWFCGAWMKNGFHEDGFASAVDVVNAMGERQAEAPGAGDQVVGGRQDRIRNGIDTDVLAAVVGQSAHMLLQ